MNLTIRKIRWTRIRSSKLMAILFAVFGGIISLEHGIGEVSHGNVVTDSIRINAFSAPGLPFPFGQEPAITIIPNYQISGVLTIVLSLLIIYCAIKLIQTNIGPYLLVLLSITVFFVGGGYGPFTALIIAWIAVFNMRSKFRLLKRFLPAAIRKIASKIWVWLVPIFILWLPFEFLLGVLFGVTYPYPGYLLSYAIPILMLVLLFTGFIRDIDDQNQDQGVVMPMSPIIPNTNSKFDGNHKRSHE